MDRNISVLLIENDRSWASLASQMLADSRSPARLLRCVTVDEALRAFESTQPDLVLLDLHPPEAGGLDTLATLHKRFPNIPVVALTGVPGEEDGLAAVRLGAEDYLNRDDAQGPLLWRVIRHAVERSRLRHLLEEARRDREARSVERLSVPPPTRVTGGLYSGGSLRESCPEQFERFSAAYGKLLDDALEESLYHTPGSVPSRVTAMAEELCRMRIGPRDVLDIHMAAMGHAMARQPRGRAQALFEEGRLLVLNLMGHVAGFYRNYYPSILARGA